MLTRLEVENARPKEKPYRVFDGRGMYLEVSPSGGRYWRLKYRYDGRENRISLGVYPDIGIKEARDRCDEARRKLMNGVDPAAERKLDKVMKDEKAANTFEAVAREWFAMHSPRWADSHSGKLIRRLEMYVFPWLGHKPIAELKPLELLTVLRARLMVVCAVLGCTKVALNNDDDSDIHPLEYADVVEVARVMIEETAVRLDSARLQRFHERISNS